MRYRLHFRNGGHGAWSDDKARVYENAKFFKAYVEVWNTESGESTFTDWNGRPWQGDRQPPKKN